MTKNAWRDREYTGHFTAADEDVFSELLFNELLLVKISQNAGVFFSNAVTNKPLLVLQLLPPHPEELEGVVRGLAVL